MLRRGSRRGGEARQNWAQMRRSIRYWEDNDPKPREYIDALPVEKVAAINLRLDYMCENDLHLWPRTWVKKIEGKVWSLKSDSHRIFYSLHEQEILILHAVRKGAWKLRKKDINRALERDSILTSS